MNLSQIPTCYLVNELVKREGVEEIVVGPDETFAAGIDSDDNIITGGRGGPARILVVID